MKRRYSRIAFEPFVYHLDDVEAAIAAGEYTKTYFLDDGTIGRVDLYGQPEGLFKVSYREVAPPYDLPLAEHRLAHPGALCEFWTPRVRSEAGLWVVRTVLYEASGEAGERSELHLDDSGRPVRAIDIDPTGQRGWERQTEYDAAGEPVWFRHYDAAGKLLWQGSHDDWG